MAFNIIDPTAPQGTSKVKFVDDQIRQLKGDIINNLQEICNYPTTSDLKIGTWTTATRPTGVDRVAGYNTTLKSIERYNSSTDKWDIVSGSGQPLIQWTTTTRPTGTSLYSGLFGYCYDLDVFERYTGTAWERINSARRGDIKMYSGSTTDIQRGWVLAAGQVVTIDGSTWTVPNLVDRFVVGAGYSYAIGATGGEATHVLTIPEMPSHSHQYNIPDRNGGGFDGWDGGEGDLKTVTSGWTGGNQAHENRPPYYAIAFIYKL